MPAKGHRTEKILAGDPSDPQGMHVLLRRYFEALELRDYSPETIKKNRLQLNDFIDWCSERDLTQPKEITRKILQNYQRHMLHQIDKRGNPFSFRNQHSRIGSIRVWFKWLMKNEHIPHNPSIDLDLPKIARRLPKNILTQQESEAILSQPDVNQPHGLRDRAMLETFYSTGMRRMELIRLQVSDLDHERGVVAIYEGKGKKDRIIPIGDRALGWIQRYLTEVRPNFVVDFGNSSLFLTSAMISSRIRRAKTRFARTCAGGQKIALSANFR